MSVVNFHIVSGFNNALYQLLKKFEAPHDDARLVGGKVKNVTIGLGFDLNAGGNIVREAVFNAIGIKWSALEMDPNAPPAGVSAAQITAEQSYIARLNAAIDAKNLSQLNAIMAERAANKWGQTRFSAPFA